MHRPTPSSFLPLTLLAAAALVPAAAGAQGEQFAVRGISTNRLDLSSSRVHSLSVNCVVPGTNTFVDCDPQGSATLRVSAATKTRLKLSSTTIAKGTIALRPAAGEGEDGGIVRATATKAVRSRLKTVKRVEVTYRLTITSPIQTVVKKTLTMTTTSSGLARLLLRSPGDTADLSGGGRG